MFNDQNGSDIPRAHTEDSSTDESEVRPFNDSKLDLLTNPGFN